MIAATKPKTIAPIGPTTAQAGVMATNPVIAPDAPPSIEGFPFPIHSHAAQPNTAAAVATCVLIITKPAVPSAASSLPTLKPNQPAQSNEAPIMVNGRLCGAILSLPYPIRLPIIIDPTNAAIPALI